MTAASIKEVGKKRKPKFCKNSPTNYCICYTALECACIDCNDAAVIPWT